MSDDLPGIEASWRASLTRRARDAASDAGYHRSLAASTSDQRRQALHQDLEHLHTRLEDVYLDVLNDLENLPDPGPPPL